MGVGFFVQMLKWKLKWVVKEEVQVQCRQVDGDGEEQERRERAAMAACGLGLQSRPRKQTIETKLLSFLTARYVSSIKL